jgi:hypothetical protein
MRRRSRLNAASRGATLLAVAAFAAAAQSTDPVMGTWQMNASSAVGVDPAVITTRIEPVRGGLRLVSEGRDAQGHVTRREYTALFDGKDYPVISTVDGRADPAAADAIAVRKIDDYNYELMSKLRGQLITVTRWAISEDGGIRTASCLPAVAERSCPASLVFEKQ